MCHIHVDQYYLSITAGTWSMQGRCCHCATVTSPKGNSCAGWSFGFNLWILWVSSYLDFSPSSPDWELFVRPGAIHYYYFLKEQLVPFKFPFSVFCIIFIVFYIHLSFRFSVMSGAAAVLLLWNMALKLLGWIQLTEILGAGEKWWRFFFLFWKKESYERISWMFWLHAPTVIIRSVTHFHSAAS